LLLFALLADLVHILVTEESDSTKTSPNWLFLAIRHQQVPKYRELIGIAEEALKNAHLALEATQQLGGRTPADTFDIEMLRKQITDFCQLGDRVVDQARRRVIDNERNPMLFWFTV
jgi:hypothetical protein